MRAMTEDKIMGATICIDTTIPKDEIRFENAQGQIIGKIVNIGKEEVKRNG